VACQVKRNPHSTQFLEVLRDSGDEHDDVKTRKASSLRNILHPKIKQNASARRMMAPNPRGLGRRRRPPVGAPG
jgi:hypothetical protein